MNTKTISLIAILLSTQLHASDSLSLGLLGVTSHAGGSADSRDWQTMKRKISNNGKVVWNPELNLTYEHNGWLINGTYVNDCQGFDAYFFGVGYQWEITKTFHASLIAGPYFRKKWFYQETRNTYTGNLMGTTKTEKKEILFVPWISLQKDFMFTNHVGAFVSISSNYALTHAVGGIKYVF